MIKDVRNGDEIDSVSAVFVYVGNDPQTQILKGQLELDEGGYIIAAEDTKTKLEGVFAAGDVRKKQFVRLQRQPQMGQSLPLWQRNILHLKNKWE